jgi:hypothetical protein
MRAQPTPTAPARTSVALAEGTQTLWHRPHCEVRVGTVVESPWNLRGIPSCGIPPAGFHGQAKVFFLVHDAIFKQNGRRSASFGEPELGSGSDLDVGGVADASGIVYEQDGDDLATTPLASSFDSRARSR